MKQSNFREIMKEDDEGRYLLWHSVRKFKDNSDLIDHHFGIYDIVERYVSIHQVGEIFGISFPIPENDLSGKMRDGFTLCNVMDMIGTTAKKGHVVMDIGFYSENK